MGPTSSVVLPGLPEMHRSRIEALLHLVASTVEDEDFRVTSTAGIGGSYDGEARPFGFVIGRPAEYEADELSEIEHRFGFRPQTDAGLYAMSNAPEDHRILCELSVAIADQFGGVIDFGGELAIPSQPLQGHLEAVPYVAANGRSYFCHMSDSTFAKAWLKCATFHMVK